MNRSHSFLGMGLFCFGKKGKVREDISLSLCISCILVMHKLHRKKDFVAKVTGFIFKPQYFRVNRLQFEVMNPDATLTSAPYSLREKRILSRLNRNWLFNLIREWIEEIEVREPKLARLLCRLIPAHCPFERTIRVFGHKLLYIPPLCKLNPFYEQLLALRFQALSFLVDSCGEDIAKYCC